MCRIVCGCELVTKHHLEDVLNKNSQAQSQTHRLEATGEGAEGLLRVTVIREVWKTLIWEDYKALSQV